MYRKTFTFRGKRYDIRAGTLDELNEKVAAKKFLLTNGLETPKGVRVGEYAHTWLETFKKPYVSKHTYSMYRNQVKCICRYIGKMKMADVTAFDVQKIVTSEYQSGKSKSHINKLIITLRQIFRQAHADRDITVNPTVNIRRPKQEEAKRRSLTDKERFAVVEVAKSHPHGLWILTMLYTGMRPSETARLKYSDITDDSIHIDGTKTSKANRTVPMPSTLNGMFGEGEGYVFKTQAGNQINRDVRDRWWRSFRRELDIYLGAQTYRNKVIKSVLPKDLTMYCLRHTYGTMAQRAGVPIDVLADLMGHESINTTRKYYIHENVESKQRAVNLLEEMWK